MEFWLNGELKHYDGDPELPLLTYLRLHEHIISAKDGCAPQAACGCCAVDLNGKAVLACVTAMKRVAGGQVMTIEGLGEYRQNVFANAFVSKGGVQCGFCIPGMVIQANALINKNNEPTRDDIAKALTPHLCRCTGYKKIIDAVECAAVAIRKEEEVPPPVPDGRVGARHPKYRAEDLVLGRHAYVADIFLPGMVYGALRFSDHPRARVLRIDTSQAEALPGVIRVLTAADVPGERTIGLIRKDWPLMIAIGEETRYVGDVLAGVVAETEAIARAAVALIAVEYEVLEPVTDMHRALEPDAPLIHAGGNLLSRTAFVRGDMDAARARTAYTATGVFQTQRIEHGYMEPECAIAEPLRRAGPADAPAEHPSNADLEEVFADGQAKEPPEQPAPVIRVLSQSQGVYDDQVQIAALLGLPLEAVRVTLVPNGGGFGGKEDLSVQGHAAVMAYLTGRPVKVGLTRDESITMHPKRHPIWMDYAVGCDAAGKLTYVKVKFVGDTGAYASVGMKVLERSAGHATGAYHVPAADVEALAAYTNNIPCGAMRGFGVNQAIFGLESCLDDLCRQGGFDRWQFRYDNALQNGDMTSTGQVIEGGAGVRETLLAVRDEFRAAKYAGLACGIKNTGVGNGMPDASHVRITVESADRVLIDHGWTEMGQGVHTIAVQTLCQETGIDPRIIRVRVDTASRQEAGMTTASRATSLVGNAVINAAAKLREDLKTHTLAELAGRQYEGAWIVDWTTKPGKDHGKIVTHYSYSYATQLVILDEDGQIAKVTAAHDAGKIYNPTLFEGQLEGSLHMGLGYAISEDMPMEGGRPKTTRLRQMGILRAKEMPELEIIGIEVPDPYGPYGAKGVGEIGLVPTAAAVANALYTYDGVQRRTLPMELPKKARVVVRSGNGAES
ncbi:MAG: molybdopterin-dependent oxidoreductase [Candidatus Promineofilum sp.]|nr:molybdopterin-dependent oxidoreductase [Promineifilum sp.]MCW5862237.1 molybdopterin-dependent oxidoreductase [Anaerolineae bacterium]